MNEHLTDLQREQMRADSLQKTIDELRAEIPKVRAAALEAAAREVMRQCDLIGGYEPEAAIYVKSIRNLKQCDDCGLFDGNNPVITKGDHHGGEKTVCADRDACHRRSPG